MHTCTVHYGHLKVDWDSQGTLTIARDDVPQSVQLSLSEWGLLLKLAEIKGWPIVAPPNPAIMPT